MVNNKIIAITIPVHNGIKYTKACLNTLVMQIESSVPSDFKFEIVVTDDGSTDGTSEWIKHNHPAVHLVAGDGELWWSGGINKAVTYALKNIKAEYVLWWNNDIHPEPVYFKNITEIIEKQDKNTLVGSKIFFLENKNTLWGMGGRFNPVTGKRHMYGEFCEDGELYREPFEVDWFPGMGTIIHKSVFERIGLLDEEKFPQYHGDSDFTYRAKKSGFRLIVHPRLVIYNDVSNTGLKHSGKFKELYGSLTSIKSNYNLIKDIFFYRKHSRSPIAFIPLLNKYFRYIGGFYKWKLLNALGVKK